VTNQNADLARVVSGVNKGNLSPVMAFMRHRGAATPDEFRPVILPERFGASALAGTDDASEAYKKLAEQGFFKCHPAIKTWSDVAGFLIKRRDAIAKDLDCGRCPLGVTQTNDYRSLLDFLQSAQALAVQLYLSDRTENDPEKVGRSFKNLRIFERLTGMALGLQECEALLIEYHRDPGRARSPSANAPVSVLSDAPDAYAPKRPAFIPKGCFFSNDLSKVEKAAKMVVPHFWGPSRDLPGRRMDNMPYWSNLGEQGDIDTEYLTGHKYKRESLYVCKIEPHQWTFEGTFREDGAHADEVFASQYLVTAKKYNFLGVLPKIIKRKGVINKVTNSVMNEFESGKPEALKAFLTSTPNGRSTQRILDLFGLKAKSVIYDRNLPTDRDYIIAVEPK
jgi:hypothetical protein